MITRNLACALWCVVLSTLLGCASYKTHIARNPDPLEAWDTGVHRLFLIGDGGEDNENLRGNLELLHQRITGSSIPSSVLFLGDNIYPDGVPPEYDTIRHDRARRILYRQMEAVSGITEQTIFIPGNHDWKKGKAGGLEFVRRQDQMIRGSGLAGVTHLPENGCGGPDVIELTEHVVLILIDSQWWLQNWDREPGINADCAINNRLDFIAVFRDILADYREQQVIVAMHHPFASAGPHNGYFTWKDHLFPLTALKSLRNFYLPLPVIGSIYPVFRGNFGNIQDIPHHKYQELRTAILQVASHYDNVIFVSGHEHSLEYHRSGKHHFLISGSGAKRSPIGKPQTMQYGRSAYGFMQLNIHDDGTIDMHIWELNPTSQTPAYSKRLADPRKNMELISVLPAGSDLDTVAIAAISDAYQKRALYRFLFGNRYRELYDVPVSARVLNLETELGGLQIVKRGGGFQTNSLRLHTRDGREYALRSIDKDASRLLPEIFESTFAYDILQDQFTASHPYGALVVPPMAGAAGIMYAEPQLFYLPMQKALGHYAEDFGDALYLMEERPGSGWKGHEKFGHSSRLTNLNRVLRDVRRDHRYRVDQPFVLRCRLFDMFLGDWDRHDGQWRWAEFDAPDGGSIYRPIPRDRDQVFSDYDGVIVRLANAYEPLLRKMSPFTDDIRRIKWFNEGAKFFDMDFLNGLSRQQWIGMAEELKTVLTDEIIESSMLLLPAEVSEFRREEITTKLKGRRDRLTDFALRHYLLLARIVQIRGTDGEDYIEVIFGNREARISIYSVDAHGDKDEVWYDRTFTSDETREIRIFGLEGNDKLSIRGTGPSGIRILFIAGEGSDTLDVGDSVNHRGIIVFDTQDRAEAKGYTQKVRYRQITEVQNTFHRTAFHRHYGLPVISLGGNPDDGFFLGGGMQWTRHRFLKHPFGSRHTATGFFAFRTSAYGLRYKGEWTDVFGMIDAGIEAAFDGPTFVQNFFGFGNDTEELIPEGIKRMDFHRVRKRGYRVMPFLRAGDDKSWSVVFSFGVEAHRVERTSGRFVSDPASGLNVDVFSEQHFLSARLVYRYRIVDQPVLARRGIDFQVSTGLDHAFRGMDPHRYFEASFATYYQLKTLGRPVIATRIGAGWHGGDYQFYHAALLGSHENFRGVRKERFAGDRVFYHNIDLRYPLFRWGGYFLPASMGIQANFDHGRVWYRGEVSDTWHYAYGGGVWISPFQALMISLSYHRSDVDDRLSAGMGFFF